MDLHLQGKVVVVLGGTTGIGRETALEFAREGCRVAVCGRSAEKLAACRQAFRKEGLTVFGTTADATQKEQVDTFADAVVREYGRLDIWINSAGANRHGPVHTLSQEDYQFILDVNLSSMFFGFQAAMRYFIPQRAGVVLSIASMSARLASPYRALYGAAKQAVRNLTATAAGEAAPYGIRVLSISPGTIETPINEKQLAADYEGNIRCIAQHIPGKPWQAAKPIVFLCSDAASYITGTDIEISGGKYIIDDPALPWDNPWRER